MNESIADLTNGSDSLSVVRNPETGRFGFWVERRTAAPSQDKGQPVTIEMSSVTWLEAEQAETLAVLIQGAPR